MALKPSVSDDDITSCSIENDDLTSLDTHTKIIILTGMTPECELFQYPFVHGGNFRMGRGRKRPQGEGRIERIKHITRKLHIP